MQQQPRGPSSLKGGVMSRGACEVSAGVRDTSAGVRGTSAGSPERTDRGWPLGSPRRYIKTVRTGAQHGGGAGQQGGGGTPRGVWCVGCRSCGGCVLVPSTGSVRRGPRPRGGGSRWAAARLEGDADRREDPWVGSACTQTQDMPSRAAATAALDFEHPAFLSGWILAPLRVALEARSSPRSSRGREASCPRFSRGREGSRLGAAAHEDQQERASCCCCDRRCDSWLQGSTRC